MLIDTGGPMAPILAKIEALRLEVSLVLCTHHHIDHVQFNGEYAKRYGCPICGHGSESGLFGGLDQELRDGEEYLRNLAAERLVGHKATDVLGLVVGDKYNLNMAMGPDGRTLSYAIEVAPDEVDPLTVILGQLQPQGGAGRSADELGQKVRLTQRKVRALLLGHSAVHAARAHVRAPLLYWLA